MKDNWFEENFLFIVAGVFCVGLILICLTPQLDEGIIYKKEFRASHYFYVMHNDDKWTIWIKKFNPEKNKWRRGVIEVTKEEYGKLKIGDYYRR